MPYEYKTVKFKSNLRFSGYYFDEEKFMLLVNDLGSQGWELIEVANLESGLFLVIFKRPKS